MTVLPWWTDSNWHQMFFSGVLNDTINLKGGVHSSQICFKGTLWSFFFFFFFFFLIKKALIYIQFYSQNPRFNLAVQSLLWLVPVCFSFISLFFQLVFFLFCFNDWCHLSFQMCPLGTKIESKTFGLQWGIWNMMPFCLLVYLLLVFFFAVLLVFLILLLPQCNNVKP